MAPNNEDATFLQRMKDPRLRPLWRLTHTLIKVRNGALTQKDVKNEDRTDYVYENKCESDNMSCYRADLLADNSRIAR
jgi:hypothetical protein